MALQDAVVALLVQAAIEVTNCGSSKRSPNRDPSSSVLLHRRFGNNHLKLGHLFTSICKASFTSIAAGKAVIDAYYYLENAFL